ncbi:HNH endonuclease [Brachybacterium kimchii]|uniref:HNH endonuclease n=1 Tax=Brachybacterium kimchii TaxID=2942909 RepID=A0ABY4N9M1_9MICO|nr:HNH endonuclease [Brachybacterium kimchii]UQN30506.1 HNH endonuclease [Brachybacterium kimchii]
MAIVKVYNKGYDRSTGIGELLHTTTVRHAMGMIRRRVAEPADLVLVDDEIVPVVLELTREISGAWIEGGQRTSVGFSFLAVHERDHWTCAYCGRGVSKRPRCDELLATVDHILPSSRGGESSWLNLVSSCKGCNNRKADRTPEEAGMQLRFDPFDPMVSYRVGGHVEQIFVAA